MKRVARYRSFPLLLLALGACTSLSGCVYRLNVQQGNFLTSETVDQLKEGMTRSQVRFLLGTPMVPDAFDDDRWDYLYVMQRGRLAEPERRHLRVFFADEKVARFESEGITATMNTMGATAAPEEKVSFWRRVFRRGAVRPAPAATP
jgi:outer membrane protein assembly factor BamE